MQLKNYLRYVELLEDPEQVKSNSCYEYRALDKCGCAANELCLLAIAKKLKLKHCTVKLFADELKKTGYVKIRKLRTRKRPYCFIALKR